MYAQPIHPDYLQRNWPIVKDWLEAGMRESNGEYTVEQLKVFVMQGRHVLLCVILGERIVGAMTIAFEDFPNERVAFVSSMGGAGIVNQEVLESVSDWCRRNGCTALRGAVRPSVAKLFKKLDFEQRYIIVEHKL